MLQPKLGEERDAIVRNHPVGRHGQHIHVAGDERLLGGVHPIGQIPVLLHARPAEHLLTDQFMTGDASRFRQWGQSLGDEDVKTVRRDEHALAGRRNRARRFCSRTRQPADRGHEDKHEPRHTHAKSVHQFQVDDVCLAGDDLRRERRFTRLTAPVRDVRPRHYGRRLAARLRVIGEFDPRLHPGDGDDPM